MLQRNFKESIILVATALFLGLENIRAFTSPVSFNSIFPEKNILSHASSSHSLSMSKEIMGSPESLQGRSPQMTGQNEKNRERLSTNAVRSTWSVPSMSELRAFAPESVSTTLKTFGGWYNEMDPVPMTHVYDDKQDDYSFVSPTSNWPTATPEPVRQVEDFISRPKGIRPRPLRTVRRVVGWLNVNISPLEQRKNVMKRNMI